MKFITECLTANKTYVEKFFYIFSRAEYALKVSGYLEPKSYASANWQSFAKAIRDKFDENRAVELKESVKYLKDYPPRKQVNREGHLEWDDSPLGKKTPNVHYVVTMICRIRNNLFHGGKFSHGSSKEISRNTMLIKNATNILCELMRLDEQVSHYFNQPLDTEDGKE